MNRQQYLPILLIAALSLFVYACSDDGDPVGPGNTAQSISVNNVTLVEGDTALFVISYALPADSNFFYTFETRNGTALAGVDYNSRGPAAVITELGSVSLSVLVSTIENAIVDGTRTFTFVVSYLVDSNIIDVTAVGTITDDEAPMVRYSTQVKPILSSRCAISLCHGSGAFSGGYSMGAGAPYNIVRNAAGINGPIIVAGNAAASNLYLKTTFPPPFGSQMPLSGPKLSITEQQLIRDWINAGALDN